MPKDSFPYVEIQPTEDGSPTLYRPDIDETYHSYRGALSESQYIFIGQGLNFLQKHQSLSVLEIGFGTGLNALLTWQFAKEKRVIVDYHTLEPYPLPNNIYGELTFQIPETKDLLLQMHESRWESPQTYGQYFTMTKYESRLEDFEISASYDVIFYDAFAPSRQAEVWSLFNLQKCYDHLSSGGLLVTYCAQGQFKRNLKSCGFEVEILPGALGKKEMVRAHRL